MIGDNCEIGAGSAVDNGAMNDTVVGSGTKIDNLVHVGHNVQIGNDCFIIAQTGIAGSTTIGNHCILAGLVLSEILLNQAFIWAILQERMLNGAGLKSWFLICRN